MRTSLLLAAAAASGACAAIDFSGSTLPLLQRPAGVTIADFDGDGRADLAATADTPDRIVIYRNTGAGLIEAAMIPTGAGTGADSVLAANVNGDGLADLAVVLKNTGTLRLYVNTGAMVFTPGASAALGVDPRGLSAADLDGDGDSDFATANRDSDTMSVVLNNGAALTVTNISAGDEPLGTAAGDFNGDGHNDLAVTSHRNRNFNVFLNQGGGVFGIGTPYPVGAAVRPGEIATGDVNGDGRADLAVTVSDDSVLALNAVAVYTSNGAGLSGPIYLAAGGFNTFGVVIADLDLNGTADIAATNQDSQTLAVFEGLGGGVFAPAALSATGARPGALAAGDVGGSATMDIVTVNRDGNTLSIFTNLTPAPVPCPADFDHSGGVDGQDVEAFFLAWESADPRSDVNGDGGVDGGDVERFFRVWEAGGC